MQPKESLTAVPHGPSAELWADGTPKITGQFQHGNKDGRWITWREDGSPRVLENWKDGELSGVRFEWDRDGVLLRASRHEDGAATSTWTRAWCPEGGSDDAGDWWVCRSGDS